MSRIEETMDVQGAKAGSRSGIPEFDQIILRTRHEQAFGGMPLHAAHIPSMPCNTT